MAIIDYYKIFMNFSSNIYHNCLADSIDVLQGWIYSAKITNKIIRIKNLKIQSAFLHTAHRKNTSISIKIASSILKRQSSTNLG